MHPILQSPRGALFYFLTWLLPGLTIFGFLLSDNVPVSAAAEIAVSLSLPYAIICLTPWYTCRLLPLRQTKIGKVLFNHVTAAFVCSVTWMTVMRWLGPARMRPFLLLMFCIGLLFYLLSVALHYVYIAVEDSKEAIRREQEARVLAREAELKALKAQINPHFLFNCLHSISALTAIDADQAREMCIRLSDFLRNTLRMGEKEAIPFAEELALVNTYLAVEQVRFGSRLKVCREISATCDRCMVPPLLLQPLVENAVKHGIAGLVDGGTIHIHASSVPEGLYILVENDFDPDSPAPRKTGMGLTNVRNRIATRHGTDGWLHVTVTPGRHKVEVLIPCDGSERQGKAK